MERKVALFAFNGEPMCFAHVLLNALNMKEKGYDIKLVIEGSATKQVKELLDSNKPFSSAYEKVKALGIIDCVCRACASAMGSLRSAEEQELSVCGDMSGHPSISVYKDAGYDVLIF